MNPDLKALWIADLRANPSLQGQGTMRTKDGHFCCLGRLCEVAGIPFIDGEYRVQEDENDLTFRDPEGTYPFNSSFPLVVLARLGLDVTSENNLIEMNDHDRLTFLEIANWIERNL